MRKSNETCHFGRDRSKRSKVVAVKRRRGSKRKTKRQGEEVCERESAMGSEKETVTERNEEVRERVRKTKRESR